MVIPEPAGDEHRGIVKPLFPVAEYLGDDPEPLDAADGVLYEHPHARFLPVPLLLSIGQIAGAGLADRQGETMKRILIIESFNTGGCAMAESILVPDTIMQEWLQALIKKTWLGEQHWQFHEYSDDGKTASFYTMLPPKGMWTIYGSSAFGKVSSIFISWGDAPIVGPETRLYKTFDRTETVLSLLASELYILARNSKDKRLPDILPLIHQAITG